MTEGLTTSRIGGKKTRRGLLFFVVVPITAWIFGCAEVACPPGQTRVNGVCTPPAEACEEPITKQFEIGCVTSEVLPGAPDAVLFNYELTVDPGPIVSGEQFAAELRGVGVFDSAIVNRGLVVLAEFVPEGFRRIEFTDFQATVHVRRGAEGEDVVLKARPIPHSCTYDEQGMKDPDSLGPFPPCSPENDLEDGSNPDCTGLGNAPHQDNRCLPYFPLEVEECNEGDESGRCAELGQTGPGGPCALVGFCVTESVRIRLEKSDGSAYRGAYTADGSGRVLFGFADGSADPGAYPLLENGPNRGAYDPDAMRVPFAQRRLGPNGLRGAFAGVPLGFECLMGGYGRRDDAVGTVDPLVSPSPDGALISCPIQEPE